MGCRESGNPVLWTSTRPEVRIEAKIFFCFRSWPAAHLVAVGGLPGPKIPMEVILF